jgi:hypothetical protein
MVSGSGKGAAAGEAAAAADEATARDTSPEDEPSPLIESVTRLLWALGPIGVILVAFALIQPTLLPGVAYWDTGEFQTVPPLLGTIHATGFPAYTILGWLASAVLQPLGEPAYRMNLFSALCIVGAAGLTVILVRSLTGRPAIGIAAGLTLGLTEVSWRIATHADAHSLHLLLLSLLLVLLVQWEHRVRDAAPGADRWLIAAAATYAVAVANHSLALLVGPGIVLFVFAVEPVILRRHVFVAKCIGTFAAVVTAFYLELPLRAGPFRAPIVYGHPETWGGFWYVVLAEQFRGDLGSPFTDLGSKFHNLVDFTAREIGPLAALLPIGIVAAAVRRRSYALLTIPTLVLTCFFSISYTNADIERYYLGPLLIAVTWVGILGAWVAERVGELLEGRLAGRLGALGSDDGSLARRAVALDVALAVLIAGPTLIAVGPVGRSVDRSGDVSASTWVDGILPELAPNAIVVSWWSYSTPLWYARDVEGRRMDITILDDRTILDDNLGDVAHVIDANIASRPVYVIRLDDDLKALEARYVVEPLVDPVGSGIVRVTGYQPGVTP